jgi:hypothetical protein
MGAATKTKMAVSILYLIGPIMGIGITGEPIMGIGIKSGPIMALVMTITSV